MRLASLLESKRSRKIAAVVIRHRRPLGLLLYVAGLVYLVQLPRDEFNHRSFIDENALMVGLVKREFTSSRAISDLAAELGDVYDDRKELMSWLEVKFASIGLEVYHQNYSATRPAILDHQSAAVSGRNVYGILRTRRASSAESLVFSAPHLSSGVASSNLHGIAVMLSLAEYFKSKNYWAKDIIFLVTTGDEIGVQAWINSYMGDSITGIEAGPLPGRSGAIQAVINLEVNSPKIEYAELVIEGVNGILPNLDLVHVVTHLSEMEGIPSALHVGWEAVRSRGRYSTGTSGDYNNKLHTVASLLAHQAPGLPLAGHALFLRHRIDSVTVRGMGSGPNSRTLKDLARALEGSFRSLNNLLERLHHSEFFYYTPSRGRFISIGQFMPPLALLLAPLILEALTHWLLARGFANLSTGTYSSAEQSPFPFHAVLSLFLSSCLSGVLLLYLPTAAGMIQAPLGPAVLAASLAWGLLLSIFTPLFSSSSIPAQSWHMVKCFSLISQLLLLVAVAIMNYALSICLLLFLPLPATLSQPPSIGGRVPHRIGQLLLLLFSPPLSLLYLCSLYHSLCSSSNETTAAANIASALEGGVGVVGRGLVLAYNSWHFVGAWLFPFGCVAVWPVWLMGWRLACQSVHKEGEDESVKPSHPHSD